MLAVYSKDHFVLLIQTMGKMQCFSVTKHVECMVTTVFCRLEVPDCILSPFI
jgi:hypothetical protein